MEGGRGRGGDGGTRACAFGQHLEKGGAGFLLLLHGGGVGRAEGGERESKGDQQTSRREGAGEGPQVPPQEADEAQAQAHLLPLPPFPLLRAPSSIDPPPWHSRQAPHVREVPCEQVIRCSSFPSSVPPCPSLPQHLPLALHRPLPPFLLPSRPSLPPFQALPRAIRGSGSRILVHVYGAFRRRSSGPEGGSAGGKEGGREWGRRHLAPSVRGGEGDPAFLEVPKDKPVLHRAEEGEGEEK